MGVAAFAGPMLLVPTSAPLPQSISSYLSGRKSGLTQAFLFGGPVAVGDDVIQAVESVG